MGKVGINVGEEFPAEEVAPSEHAPENDRCRNREGRRDKARGFREHMRRAVHKHFGGHSFTAHNGTILRVLFAVAIIALLLAVLPHMLVVAMLVLGAVLLIARRGHFHHYDQFQMPHGDV
jgi:Flp pilus assembly protein TadB